MTDDFLQHSLTLTRIVTVKKVVIGTVTAVDSDNNSDSNSDSGYDSDNDSDNDSNSDSECD